MDVKVRTARLAVALAAAALVAASCGGDSGDGTGEDAATQATSAQATTAAAPTGAAPATAVPSAATAAADELPTDAMELLHASAEASSGRSVRGEVSLALPGPSGGAAPVTALFEADAEGDVAVFVSLDELMPAELDEPERAPASGAEVEFRFVSGVEYVRFVAPPGLLDEAGAGLPPQGWFTVARSADDASDPLCPSPLVVQSAGEGGCRAPNDFSDLLALAAGAEIVGAEDLEGMATTRVDVLIDLAALAETASAEGAVADDDDLAGFLSSGLVPGELIVSFWVDADALTRRIAIDLGSLLGDLLGMFAEESGETPDGLPQLGQVISFHDYDADISIEAPPADEIVGDYGDIMGAEFGVG